MTAVEKEQAVQAPPERRPGGGLRGRFGRLPWPARTAIIVGCVVLAYGLPYVGYVPMIGPQIVTQGIDWSSALFSISYFVLLALGLNVVVGYAGLLDLGYVGFFAVGAYTVALLTSPDSVLKTHWAWLAAVPVAIVIALLSGLLLGWPTLRLRGDYLAIVTLGFAEIIRIFAESIQEALLERGRVAGNFALPNICVARAKSVFDWAFDCQNVTRFGQINFFDQRSQRGGFPAAGRAAHQD